MRGCLFAGVSRALGVRWWCRYDLRSTVGGDRDGPGVGGSALLLPRAWAAGNVLLLSQAWEAIQPEFSTNADGVACYKGVPFELDGGVCSSKVKGGVIS